MNIAEQTWDVVVVGAGPAGAMAALVLAERGATVLLVDKAEFPRPKVCGCCLSGAALAELSAAHVHGLTEELGAVSLHELRLFVANGRARIPIAAGVGLSRAVFDAGLVHRAVQRGATFISGMSARLTSTHSDEIRVGLRRESDSFYVRARVMLAADGLSGTSLDSDERFAKRTTGHSLIGANTIVDAAPPFYEPGSIFMACDDGGYVGLVRIEDQQLDIAAALNPDYVRRMRSPAGAVAGILTVAGLPPIAAMEQAGWHGTPYLTSKRKCLAAPRVFVIGDAAGYVEPFTGEGIAWALASGRAVIDLACDAITGWRPELAKEWERVHRRLLGGRQRLCHWITRGLRQPKIRRLGVQMLAQWPRLGEAVARTIHRPFHPRNTWSAYAK